MSPKLNPIQGKRRLVSEFLKDAFIKTNFAESHEISIFVSDTYDSFGIYIRNNQINGYIKVWDTERNKGELSATFEFTISYSDGSTAIIGEFYPVYLTNLTFDKKLINRDIKVFVDKLENYLRGFDDSFSSNVKSPNEYEQRNLDIDRRRSRRKSNPSKGKSVLGAMILGGIIGHSMKK